VDRDPGRPQPTHDLCEGSFDTIPSIPWYITTAVLSINVLIAVVVWRLVVAGAHRAGLDDGARSRLAAFAAAGLGGWLGAVLLSAPPLASLASTDPYQLTLLIPFFSLGGIGASLFAVWRSPDLRRALAAIPLPAVVGVQYYRVVGATFVVLLSLGQLPAHFALPAGWGDVGIGLLAPLVALALMRIPALGRPLAWGWNLLGLLDLVVAVGMGTGVLAPYLHPELGARVPAAGPMGAFPMMVVPAFAVPVSLLLHLLSLRGLARYRREAVEGAPQVA
jgi:uncharacterized membrane protein